MSNNKPLTSFKKFLRKQAPLTLTTIRHRRIAKQTAALDEETAGVGETEQLDELSPAKLGQYISKSKADEDKRRARGREVRAQLNKQFPGMNFSPPLDRRLYSPTASRQAGRKLAINKLLGQHVKVPAKEEIEVEGEQLDELAKTPMNSSKTQDLHDRLSKFYNIDDKDKEGIKIFQQFGNHINNALTKAAAPKEEKSKPDPIDAESEKVSADAQAAAKKIDQLLGMHKGPNHDFHVYAGLKAHPFENIKAEQGYDPEGEPVEAHLPGFTQASIDPNFAKQNVGKKGHILKLCIKAGSKHGAYIGHHNEDGHDKEFLMRPGRKVRIHPEPEQHGDHHIWHGEVQG